MAIQFTYGNRKVNLNLLMDWGVDLEVAEVVEIRKQQTEWYRKGISYGYRMTFHLPMNLPWYRCEICGEPIVDCGQCLGICELCDAVMTEIG